MTVEGYIDSKGGAAANKQLADARAQAVKDWLVKNGNVPGGPTSSPKAWASSIRLPKTPTRMAATIPSAAL